MTEAKYVYGQALYGALSKAQANVENAKKVSNNPHFKSKYADLATIWDVIREPFTKEGLSILQCPVSDQGNYGDKIGLRTVVTHSSGERLDETFYVGLKDPTNPQQVGSALTYMKRYALLGVAGIASEDDDGNDATGRPGPSKPEHAVDYTDTFKEAMTRLEAASDVEARSLYAAVRNSGMQEGPKNELLKKMADFIQKRAKKETV